MGYSIPVDVENFTRKRSVKGGGGGHVGIKTSQNLLGGETIAIKSL